MKYQLVCKSCGHITSSMSEWFSNNQKCLKCEGKHVLVNYSEGAEKVKQLIENNIGESVFDYFDFLPLENKENIVTSGEGVIPVEHWSFLDRFAKKSTGLIVK